MIANSLQILQLLQPLKKADIKNWLEENKSLSNKVINDTLCHKWKKWQRDNSLHIFPCVCPTRNEECCFSELYKNLQDFIQTIRTEDFYKHQLEIYESIKQNQKAIFEWIIDIMEYGKGLILIKNKIHLKNVKDENSITILFDKKELPNLWNFKKKFEKHYYSYEFNRYTER